MVAPTIEGYRYKTTVEGIGASGYDTKVLFLPSLQLIILAEGHCYRSDTGPTSKKAESAFNEYLNKHQNDYSYGEIIRVRDEAEAKARKVVQLPKEKIDRINELYQKKMSEAATNEEENELKELAKALFV